MLHQSGAPSASVRSFPKEQWYRARVFFSPLPLPLPRFLLSFALAPTVRVTISTHPIFHCHKIKDSGYNNINTNKVSPTQNTPALQANLSLESKDATCVGFLCERANSHRTSDFAGDPYLQAPFRNVYFESWIMNDKNVFHFFFFLIKKNEK